MPRRGNHLPRLPEVHGDVIPVRKPLRDGVVGRRIRFAQVQQGLVREHHAKAKGILRPVALDHRDAAVRVGLLHQDGKVQPRRAAADAGYVHK